MSPPTTPLPRRDFITGAVALSAATLTEPLLAQKAPRRDELLGPILGHSSETSAMVWLRAPVPGEWTLEVTPEAGGKAIRMKQAATEKDDLCLHWQVTDLQPGSIYRYRILREDGTEIAAHAEQTLTTAPPADAPAKVRLAISSCAKEDVGSRAVWNRMASENVDAVVLIGDTPYIDSTDLEKQTQRHREFAAVEEYQALLRSRPCWWTWDDHDFAGNDSSGLAAGKENARLVVTRYRPQAVYGDGEGGIYTRFRRGPVEVFLLDTRWYAMTEPSFASSHRPTMLGAKQWEWLQQGLLASTAPFKILACGVIWDDKLNAESDDWGTYKHELTAIQKFIGEHKIPGVILMGGDIHASRVLCYPTEKNVGYKLVQFIASPIHASTIPSLNVYHPDLVRSAVEPNVFLRVDADATVTPPQFVATLINKDGEHVFSYHLSTDDLSPKS
ncbi:MAG: alkaline phosphatase family protein [Verrucomicrobiaceae bacterium]|nr:alkaline phosphatase family protein [Verrucomicrobiaceae bacterium]